MWTVYKSLKLCKSVKRDIAKAHFDVVVSKQHAKAIYGEIIRNKY